MSEILFETQTFERNKVKTKQEKKLIFIQTLLFVGFLASFFFIGKLGFPEETIKPLLFFIYIFFGIIHIYFNKKNQFSYGTFPKKLIFTKDDITIGDAIYSFSEIQNVNFENIFYNGEGPSRAKKPGIQNVITIYCNGSEIKENFYIENKVHLNHFTNSLIFIICNEKIAYRREYLNFIRDEYKHSSAVFEEFIAKLIKERKLDCTEGLLLIGYDSDAEAKELRTKYCS